MMRFESARQARRVACSACLALVFIVWLSATAAAAPQITNISLRGLRSGATTTLTIEGADLLPEPRILLSAAISAQAIKPGATASRVQMDVTLPQVPAGMYKLRLANARGISNSVLIGIDDLAQMPFGTHIDQLPAALTGNLAYGTTLHTSFTGKKGQRLVVDLEARRLGAAFDPVVELYDARRVQLAYSQGHTTLQGDARLEAVLPAAGPYLVEVHDLLYQGGNPDYFRLKIGTLAFADLLYPMGGQRDSTASCELIGSGFPQGSRLQVDLHGIVSDIPAALPHTPGLVGPAPRLVVGEFPEVMETMPPAGKLQEVTAPAVINGRIGKAHEEDRYRLLVKSGMHLRFDVLANRAGSPLDGDLFIRNEAGAQLAVSDDRPDTVDPGLDFTVPDGVKALVVALKDVAGRGGQTYIYRLAITPADCPDFSLTLFEDRLAVPQGGAGILRVRANRAGYNGAIKLLMPGPPNGLRLAGTEIPAGAAETLVSLAAPDGVSAAPYLTRVIGQAGDSKAPLERVAMLPDTAATRNQPWLRSELAVAISEPGPIRIAWDSQEPSMAVGSSLPIKVQLTRLPKATGAVRLTLLTSQIVPRTADGKREDSNRALRFQGMPTIAAGQTTATAAILVPGDLPALPYDLAVQGDLLAPDNRTVLASAVSPSRRLNAGQPFSLQLAGKATVEAKSGSGPTGKLSGKVVRAGGFNRPVTVTLLGLPAELPAPSVNVPADKSDFELSVAFPYETKPGPLSNIKLVATSQVAGGSAIKSNEIPVTIQVVRGDPPPAAPPLYRIFEDEANFPALLIEGDGQAALENVDRYSGREALRVTGGQRLRTKMPGWGFKIAEKPGNGEFRYLRFAWKKRGGSNIMLQLNANGNWGPRRSMPGPSYRYEAGPGDNPFAAAAIKLDAKVPDDWVVVTRDLFADFGPFRLTGMAFTPGPGEYALYDHLYLARTLDDLKACPAPVPPQQPRTIFEDQAAFVAELLEGAGTATLDTSDKYSGKASVRVTPDQRFNERLPGLGISIRQNPGSGEYRFLRFAWKKKGGQSICLQLNHDGNWGPTEGAPGKFRYHAGPGPECYGASIAVDDKIPSDWVVVTRDLYADFGEFTWTGIALSPVDGEYALFDHIYLGRTTRDFELVKPKTPTKTK
jgi:hypothetical protein